MCNNDYVRWLDNRKLLAVIVYLWIDEKELIYCMRLLLTRCKRSIFFFFFYFVCYIGKDSVKKRLDDQCVYMYMHIFKGLNIIKDVCKND